MPSIAHHAGGAQARAPQGDPDPAHPPPNHPLPRVSQWVLQGSWLTWPEQLALGGGDSQPRIPSLGWRPSPALMSAGLAAFQLIFCPMLCLPSRLLQGLGLVGGGHGHSPPGPRRGLPAGSWPGFTPSRGAEPRCQPPDPGAEAALAPRWLPTMAGGPQLGRGSTHLGSPPFYPRDTVPPQLTVPSGAVPSAAPAAPAGSGSARTMPA